MSDPQKPEDPEEPEVVAHAADEDLPEECAGFVCNGHSSEL
jgi:hypothetical protein